MRGCLSEGAFSASASDPPTSHTQRAAEQSGHNPNAPTWLPSEGKAPIKRIVGQKAKATIAAATRAPKILKG